MNNRVDIKNFILHLESQFPVNEWKFNDIHIWPFIRIKIFFHLIEKIESSKTEYKKKTETKRNIKPYKPSYFIILNKKLKKTIKGILTFFWITKLPKKDLFYLSSNTFRVNYKGVRYNRFFDTINDLEGLNEYSIVFEQGEKIDKKRYNEKNIEDFEINLNRYIDFKNLFFNTKKHDNWKDYNEFLSHLNIKSFTPFFIESLSFSNLTYWYDNYFRHINSFFKKCIDSVKPKKVFILCYYYDIAMGLTCAANQKYIPTFEMQHGPQTDIHLAYGAWSNIAEKGYDILPRNFLCWDDVSKKTIDNWSENNNLYSSILYGNPWINYWKKENNKYTFNNYILYTLQPFPFTFEKLFFKELVDIIKESKKKWFVRLHPRQFNEYQLIEQKLKEIGILDFINIYDATHDPLPILLSNAFLHVTNFSGTTLEANFFNLKTIFIHKNGRDSFKEFIDNQKAIYIDQKAQEFKIKLLSIINN